MLVGGSIGRIFLAQDCGNNFDPSRYHSWVGPHMRVAPDCTWLSPATDPAEFSSAWIRSKPSDSDTSLSFPPALSMIRLRNSSRPAPLAKMTSAHPGGLRPEEPLETMRIAACGQENTQLNRITTDILHHIANDGCRGNYFELATR